MEVTLLGEIPSTNRIYRYSCVGGFLRGYMSSEGRARKDEYSWQFKAKRPKGWKTDERYEVSIQLYFKNKRPHDIDNYNKVILDSAIGIIWDDDKQIQKLTITKAIDRDNPRAFIVINRL